MPNGSILNLSSKPLWVVETDAGRAIAHKLGRDLRSPPNVDCDGVKAVDGTRISNHGSWWKFRVIQVEVRDDGSALKITRCIAPACYSVQEGEFGAVSYDNSDGWGVPILPRERHKMQDETLTGYQVRHAVIKDEGADYYEVSYWTTGGGSVPPTQPCRFQRLSKSSVIGKIPLGQHECGGERMRDVLLMIRSNTILASEEGSEKKSDEDGPLLFRMSPKKGLDHLSPEQMEMVKKIEQQYPYEPKTTVFRAERTATQRVELGTHNLPKEYRGCWRHGVDARDCRIKVWADISHPTINDFFNDALQCALGCATGAFILAVATGVGTAVAVPAFVGCFKVCLAAKVGHTVAEETSITVNSNKDCDGWSGH